MKIILNRSYIVKFRIFVMEYDWRRTTGDRIIDDKHKRYSPQKLVINLSNLQIIKKKTLLIKRLYL